MNTTVDYRNHFEVRKEGMDALVQRLGKAGTVRFLQGFCKGSGDYTKERHTLYEGMSIDEIADAVCKMQEAQ